VLLASVLLRERWRLRDIGPFREEYANAYKLFGAGDYRAAADGFRSVAKKYQRLTNQRAHAELALGATLVRVGDLSGAVDTFASLDGWLVRGRPAFKGLVASQLAVLYALKGEPRVSERWSAETRHHLERVTDGRRMLGVLLFVDLVNGIHRDDEAAALTAFEATWRDSEKTFTASELRPGRVLRAFATTRRRPLENLVSDPQVTAAFADAQPGELDWMGAEWPEMREFIEALGPKRPAP
jgi:hypothetical protein